MTNQVIHGDCMEVLAEMEDNSIDTIITDPPYGLKFMSKNWDHGIPGIPFWAEMLRVAKPGATLLAFGGTRTHHRLMVAIEDAGWEIRDCLMWLYGSGFPKSHNISKAIDKATITDCANCNGKGFVMPELPSYEELVAEDPDNHITYEDWLHFQTPEGIIARQYKCADCNGTGKVKGKEREVVGESTYSCPKADNTMRERSYGISGGKLANGTTAERITMPITAPATEAAKTFNGFGTGLKPAYEPIILAMKPIEKNYANNAMVWGVAGLNIDGARIGLNGEDPPVGSGNSCPNGNADIMSRALGNSGNVTPSQGRWPANVLLSHSEGCVRRGERKVRGAYSANGITKNAWWNPEGGEKKDWKYTDPNGLETVADWECVEDCAVRLLDEQSGQSKSSPVGFSKAINGNAGHEGYNRPCLEKESYKNPSQLPSNYTDSGGASRFFYTSKAPNREKWFFCQLCAQAYPNKERDNHGHDIPKDQRKHIVAHPTVKPLEILKYLCTLTKTPTGGIVLDPFAGSGTTALACIETGRDFILIEKEADYYQIAKARVEAAMNEPRQAELF